MRRIFFTVPCYIACPGKARIKLTTKYKEKTIKKIAKNVCFGFSLVLCNDELMKMHPFSNYNPNDSSMLQFCCAIVISHKINKQETYKTNHTRIAEVVDRNRSGRSGRSGRG